MTEAPSLLVDVRETDELHGFHAIAALYLIAGRLRSVDLYRIGGGTADERIACGAFRFDTGQQLRAWNWQREPDRRFDVYLSAADTFPWDETSVAARRASRRTVAALMFGLREFQPGFEGVVVVGHDTAEVARNVISELLPQEQCSGS